MAVITQKVKTSDILLESTGCGILEEGGVFIIVYPWQISKFSNESHVAWKSIKIMV